MRSSGPWWARCSPSNRGIGYLINSSASQFDTAGVFAGLLVLTVLATGFSAVLGRIERTYVRS